MLGKIFGVSLRLSVVIYSVSGMLTISQDQLPYSCEKRSAGTRFGPPQLEAGATGDASACRPATGQSAIARPSRDQPPASLDSVDRAVAVGCDKTVVFEQRRLV
jgi:hypothetical protein